MYAHILQWSVFFFHFIHAIAHLFTSNPMNHWYNSPNYLNKICIVFLNVLKVSVITNSLILLHFYRKIVGYKGDLSLCICIKFMLIASTISQNTRPFKYFFISHTYCCFKMSTLYIAFWTCYSQVHFNNFKCFTD